MAKVGELAASAPAPSAIAFTDRIETFLRPRKGKDHVLRVIREVLYFRPEGRTTDIAMALQHMHRTITKRSVVFVISDFLGADFTRPLRVAARKHDLIALTVTDPREEDLPAVGLLELEDSETGDRVLVDAADKRTRQAFHNWGVERRLQRQALFRSVGVDALELRTDRPYDVPLVRFFHQRARRMSR